MKQRVAKKIMKKVMMLSVVTDNLDVRRIITRLEERIDTLEDEVQGLNMRMRAHETRNADTLRRLGDLDKIY